MFVSVGKDYSHHRTDIDDGSQTSSTTALLAADEGPATRATH